MGMDGLGVLALFAGFYLLFFIIGGILYVLKSLGLSKIAANRGIENAWLAWVPVADLYIIGTLVEEVRIFDGQIKNLGLWYPVATVVGCVLSPMPIIGWVLVIALIIFQIVIMYNLFAQYTEQAVLFTVLSVLFGFLWPIFIFALRNNPVLDKTESPNIPQ